MKGACTGRPALLLLSLLTASCGDAKVRDAMPVLAAPPRESAAPQAPGPSASAPGVGSAPASATGSALVAAAPALRVGDFVIPGGRMELHAGAHRILAFQPDRGPERWGWLWVFDAETKAKLAIAPIAIDDTTTAFPRFSVSSDGARVGWAMGNVGVMEVATGKTSYLEKRAAPLAERDWPSAPIFASDGRHVCLEEHGGLTILPMPAPPLGLTAECFVWKRSQAEGTSAYDEEAIVADMPVASGSVALLASKRGGREVVPWALSPDHSLAVLTEISLRSPGSRSPLRLALLAFDLTSDKTLARIAIPSVDSPPDGFAVTIDATKVGYCVSPPGDDAQARCFQYDLRSGALLRPPQR